MNIGDLNMVSENNPFGFSNHFVNRVRTEWLDDGRSMLLLRDFSFFDARGVMHTAKEGLVFDGASIPRFLWSSVGSPFTGNYRKSAVIHDQLCKNRTLPAKRVHEIFYEAMLVEGVCEGKASLMWAAVRAATRW